MKLTKADSGEGKHTSPHRFIDLKLVAEVEDQKVRTVCECRSGRHLGRKEGLASGRKFKKQAVAKCGLLLFFLKRII